jgi:hypothetical protein
LHCKSRKSNFNFSKGGNVIGTDSNHCQVVRDSMVDQRAVDEQTFASLAVLSERLERLRKLDKAFYGVVEFSPAVKKLKAQNNKVLV